MPSALLVSATVALTVLPVPALASLKPAPLAVQLTASAPTTGATVHVATVAAVVPS